MLIETTLGCPVVSEYGSAETGIISYQCPRGSHHVSDDTIHLENTGIFSALVSGGALAAGAFNTGSAAIEADDRIIYNAATGALLYDADGTGASAAVRFATLVGVAGTLAEADFLII